jgi:glucose-1-phosphate thymidylyltransferase
MHCIIPAAGIGTRMRPHTWSVPKPLLPVAGKPILGHLIDSLSQAGVDRVTLITGYLGEMLVEWTRNAYPGLRVDFVRQDTADGLGAAVGLARGMVEEGPVMVALSDTLFTSDLGMLRECGGNMLAVCPVGNPERFGIVVTDASGKVLRLVEKPSEPVGDLAIVGIYHFASGPAIMEACARLKKLGIRTRGEYQLTDAMQLMLSDGESFTTWTVDDWFDCGTTATLLDTNRALLDSRGGEGAPELENSVVVPPCSFGAGVSVCNSVVGPHVSAGEGVRIRDSVVRNCILGPGSRVSGGFVTGSMLGARASLVCRERSLSAGDDCTVEI